jgi:hypothetical protein
MDQKTPLVFANQVIRKFVDNLLGQDMIVLPEDYLAIRTAFRSSRGEWEEVKSGNLVHLRILTNIVKAWGRMPQRRREVEI